MLGIPTVADRVAQMVVQMVLEPTVELVFLPDSYGNGPGKSALDAVAVTRQRCWQYDWVLAVKARALRQDTDVDGQVDIPESDRDWPERMMNRFVAELERLAASEVHWLPRC